MKKIFFSVFILFFSLSLISFARGEMEVSQAQIDEALGNARAMQAQIEAECRKDPYVCSCQSIPCADILQADHPRAGEVYERCVAEKGKCESQRQAAIKKIEETQSRIEADCRKDINSCNCESVEEPEGRKKCELAIIEAKYQAEKERADKIRVCSSNPDGCDCASIADPAGRAECEQKLGEAKAMRAKMEGACKADPIACDCSIIESESGKKICEEEKSKGLEEADSKIKEALSKCFRDVEKCNCSALDLPEQSYVSFCETQKHYGLSCKHEGLNCEKLDDIEIYPPGMPSWLGGIFVKSYASYVEKEKSKGAKEAAGIISDCLNSPENCRCDLTPTYARAFCEKNKALQIKCQNGDYDACIVLDETPNLPEGVPAFSYTLLDNLVGGLRNARKQLIQSNAARKVGAMILRCMDNSADCDCSLAPSGNIKSFCIHKQDLVNQCRGKKVYEACFKLDEEANYPVETPNVIKNYIQKNVVPEINTKKQKIFDEMKKGTVCDGVSTIPACKSVYYSDKK